ncbi:hypothetical protein GWK47_051469 [Chionoecetes opilio]|uniref:Uncharacterized protein n=1 Tax=Chionoecetes opilio TaxID=41210 RepID=A0A8J5CS10_CHIOP|nr:hypothetical protein GWK47_051469 [Chionoecetes opilio]
MKASRRADEGTSRVALLEHQVAAAEEQLEQHRWQEATLRQQVEAGEQRTADLRAEVTKVRAQVRDLRVYSSALRTVGGGRTTTPRSAARTLRLPSRASLGSQESLEGGGGGGGGPRSLGSEDGEAGSWWREARLGGAGVRVPRGQAPRTPGSSLPPSLPSPPPSLPPLASLPAARPSSGACVLPPIEAGRGGASRHVRRQIRLTSAPAPGPRTAAVPQREPT